MSAFKVIKILKSVPYMPRLVQLASAAALAEAGDRSGKLRALQAVLNAESCSDVGMLTLERLKAKDTIPILRSRMTSSTEYFVRNHCRLAILRIELSGLSNSDQVNVLRDALLEDGYFHVRKWAAIRLGEMGGDQARNILVSIAKDPKTPGNDAALKGLRVGIEQGNWTMSDVRQWLGR